MPMGGGGAELLASMDKTAQSLAAGAACPDAELYGSVLSDNLSSLNREERALELGQVLSLICEKDGACAEKMYEMTASGAVGLGKR